MRTNTANTRNRPPCYAPCYVISPILIPVLRVKIIAQGTVIFALIVPCVIGFGKGPKNLVIFLHFDEKTPKCCVKILPKSSENAEFGETIIYELSVMRREDFLEKDAHGWYNG